MLAEDIIQVVTESRVKIQGLINLDSVATYELLGSKFMAQAGREMEFDFAEAKVQGSAVIALLVEWQRRARAHNIEMKIVNATAELKAIAKLAGVIDILPFDVN